jgi:thioredoxin-like negative regulator of GroEL
MIMDKVPNAWEEDKPAITGAHLNSTIIELNEGNLERKLGREHDQLLVIFYAPWW